MIHVGHVSKLIDLVNQPENRVKCRKVTLDVYPRFHYGPNIPKTIDKVSRSFGATYSTFEKWEGEPSLEIRKAVMCMLYTAIRKADTAGIDIVSKASALYIWLRRLGIENIDATIDVLGYSDDLREIAGAADPFRNHRGDFRKSGEYRSVEMFDIDCVPILTTL